MLLLDDPIGYANLIFNRGEKILNLGESERREVLTSNCVAYSLAYVFGEKFADYWIDTYSSWGLFFKSVYFKEEPVYEININNLLDQMPLLTGDPSISDLLQDVIGIAVDEKISENAPLFQEGDIVLYIMDYTSDTDGDGNLETDGYRNPIIYSQIIHVAAVTSIGGDMRVIHKKGIQPPILGTVGSGAS